MTGICLGVGCERQSKVCGIRLVRKPLLLFRHRCRVRPEKGKGVEGIVKYKIIEFSRLRIVDGLPRFIEMLQGKGVVGEIGVLSHPIRRKALALPRDFHSFFILPLRAIDNAQIAIGYVISRVVLNHLLICLGGLVQFAGYILVVDGGDAQLFPFAGMLPQLECLGEVLAGSPCLAETAVGATH